MPRTNFAGVLPLLALLALLVPCKAMAGPPPPPAGKMVLDEVADGLRKYRLQRSEDGRIAWLKRLAPTGDPRVKSVLKEATSDRSAPIANAAWNLLVEHYARVGDSVPAHSPDPDACPRRRGQVAARIMKVRLMTDREPHQTAVRPLPLTAPQAR